MNGTMKDLFASAASLLLGEAPWVGAIHDVHLLLTELGYLRPNEAGDGRQTLHRARLLQAASHFIRMFELAAPDAPGLVAFGAEVDPVTAGALHRGSPPVSVSGIGVTMQEAFQGCVGEGIEYLSQLQHAGDALIVADGIEPARELDQPARELVTALLPSRAGSALSWYSAVRLSDRHEVLLPADLCLRRPQAAQDLVPPFPLSIGSAAGTSWEGAALHGLFELIERDAASLWWRGGLRGRAVPAEVEAAAQELLGRLRSGASLSRRSWLLDITTDIGVPAVAALSCRPDGFGLAFGLAARRSLHAAARSAVLEMCQIELALAVVEAKRRERGEAALNAKDLSHLQRATAIDANRCALLHPAPGMTEQIAIDADPENARAALHLIVRRLAELGIEAYGLDLTRPHFAVPVARIVAPGLQAEPSGFATSRLSGMIGQTGGGAAHSGGIPLI
ncbi:MAG: YcaO-like family protein [Xanthobacteraceae bacterium]